jgi:hypothetical protein
MRRTIWLAVEVFVLVTLPFTMVAFSAGYFDGRTADD